eukprot:845643-Prymnesium_polylepis.1
MRRGVKVGPARESVLLAARASRPRRAPKLERRVGDSGALHGGAKGSHADDFEFSMVVEPCSSPITGVGRKVPAQGSASGTKTMCSPASGDVQQTPPNTSVGGDTGSAVPVFSRPPHTPPRNPGPGLKRR